MSNVYNSLVKSFENSLTSLKMLRDNDQLGEEAELMSICSSEIDQLLKQIKEFNDCDRLVLNSSIEVEE